MICYFDPSAYLANLSDGGDYCPWQGLSDGFQDSEILLISADAVAGASPVVVFLVF
jgi:hypothetical protein